jgi:hypothetical protein
MSIPRKDFWDRREPPVVVPPPPYRDLRVVEPPRVGRVIERPFFALAGDDFALRPRTSARVLVEFNALAILAAEAEALPRAEPPAPVFLASLFAEVAALRRLAAEAEAVTCREARALLPLLLGPRFADVAVLRPLAAEAEVVLLRGLPPRPALLDVLLRVDAFRFGPLLDAFWLLVFPLVFVALPFLAPKPSAAPETAPINAPESAPVRASRVTLLSRDTASAASFADSTVLSAASLTTSAVSARASCAVMTMSFFLRAISLPRWNGEAP